MTPQKKNLIHPTALIDKKAELDLGVSVGPFAVIEAGVRIGKGSTIGAHTCIKEGVRMGTDNIVSENVIIGGNPQDIKFDTQIKSFVSIGSRNTFREQITIHRSTQPNQSTLIGDDNFLMCQVHLAHDSRIGSHVIIANSTLLAGYAEVDDHAFISGHVTVHQYNRIGTLAMVAALTRITSDVPPFSLTFGHHGYFLGLNVVGLRRHNMTPAQRIEIKKFYKDFYETNDRQKFLTEITERTPSTSAIRKIVTFIQGSTRGLIKKKP